MKRKTLFLFSFFFIVTLIYLYAHGSQAEKVAILADTDQPEYRLAWQEDFTSRQLNPEIWNKIKRDLPDVAWMKYMSDHPSLYKLSNGRLRLYARVNKNIAPDDTARYLTGGVSTWHKKNITYGKIEVRARIKGAQGCWPAIWIKNEDSKEWAYPNRAEIDILEYYNRDGHVVFTIHNNYTDILKKVKQPLSTINAPIKKEKYNTYCIEILPDRLIYSVNGEVLLTYPKIETKEEGQFPFGTPCYLLMDMQVGNQWLKDINDNHFPAYMDIDWVKFYDLVQ